MSITTLSIEGCRTRQSRLRELLKKRNLTAALLGDARHVFYFTGHWTRAIWPRMAVVFADNRPTLLCCGVNSGEPLAADEVINVNLNPNGTIVDRPAAVVCDAIAPRLKGVENIGVDIPPIGEGFGGAQSILQDLIEMRRAKDADEVALLRRSVAAIEAAYARAREIIKPGLTEMELYAEVIATAAKSIGEPFTGEIGNDFRSGSGGGSPRDRVMREGELLPLDLGIPVRGYTGDLCRTFCVGGKPNEIQSAAHARILETIAQVEPMLRPGTNCAELHRIAKKNLNGFHGLSFGHHLGHGIGLDVHEAPRLNDHWNDTLLAGDVVTVEPGLYGDALNGGIRIENDYLITRDGCERLSKVTMDF